MKAPAHLLNWPCVEIASSIAVTTECQFKPNVHFTILDLFQAAAHCFMSDKQTVGIECNPKHTLVYKMTKNQSFNQTRAEKVHTQSLLGAAQYTATVLYCCDFSETVQQHPDRRSTALLSSVSPGIRAAGFQVTSLHLLCRLLSFTSDDQ